MCVSEKGTGKELCISKQGTGKELCISKLGTGKEIGFQILGPEKNFDLKYGTGTEFGSQIWDRKNFQISHRGTGKAAVSVDLYVSDYLTGLCPILYLISVSY